MAMELHYKKSLSVLSPYVDNIITTPIMIASALIFAALFICLCLILVFIIYVAISFATELLLLFACYGVLQLVSEKKEKNLQFAKSILITSATRFLYLLTVGQWVMLLSTIVSGLYLIHVKTENKVVVLKSKKERSFSNKKIESLLDEKKQIYRLTSESLSLTQASTLFSVASQCF